MSDDTFKPAHDGSADAPEHAMTHALGLVPHMPEVARPAPSIIFARASEIRPGNSEVALKRKDVSILQRGDTIPLPPLDWLWPGFLLAGRAAILAGQPGQGKTSLAIDLAARVTTGAPWPDGAEGSAPGDAILVSYEDGTDTLAARATACGADMGRLLIADTNLKNVSLANLEAAIALLPRPRLMMIDPITSVVPGDMNTASVVRAALAPYVAIADRFRLCLLLLSHTNKGANEGRSPLERITGSGAFGALPRVAMLAIEDRTKAGQQHSRMLVRVKSNEGPSGDGIRYALDRKEVAPGRSGQFVHWGEIVRGNARDIIAAAEAVPGGADGGAASDTDAELIALLQALLADGPRTPGDVIAEAVAAGFNPNKIDKAKARAGIKSVKVGMSGGWFWRLREDRSPTAALQPSQSSQPSQPSSFPPFSKGDEGADT